MPSKEDVLFCKIAIMNGLVSEADAQKVLTLCDRREKEAGRRPSIGAVFSKYNLIRTRDVEKVYDAVRKRTGSNSNLPKAGSRNSTVRGGSRTGRSTLKSVKIDPSRMDKVKAQKSVDSTTLALGIGGLLVFVGILLTIILLMTSGGSHKAPDVAKTPVEEKEPTSKIEAPKASPLPKPTPPKPVEPPKITDTKDLPQQVRQDLIERLADARKEDDPRRALSMLESFQQKLTTDYGFSPPDLAQEIATLREAAKTAGPAEAPPTAPPEDAPPKTP